MRPLCCLGLIVLIAGCGPDRRVAARQAAISGDAQAQRAAINDLYGHHLAEDGETSTALSQSRHLLLWRLERGAAAYARGDDLAAVEHFTEATRLAREARTRSLARAASAAVINDNLTRWSGEAAELVRIPAYGGLAHLSLAQQAEGLLPGGTVDPAAAALHGDRAASAALALVDQLERLKDGELGTGTYQDDPWLWTLAGVLRKATAVLADDHTGARLCADRAEAAWAEEGTMPAVVRDLLPVLRGEASRDQGWVLVLEDSGWVPLRQELRIYITTVAPPASTGGWDVGGVFIYVDGPGKEHLDPLHGLILPGELIRKITRGRFGVFGCEIPVIPALGRRPALGRAAGPTVAGLEAVDDIGADVSRCFMDGQKSRVLAIIVRTVAKLIAARQGVEAIKDSGEGGKNEALAEGLWLLLTGLVTTSEQADTRCWSQLPGRSGATLLTLAPGDHHLTLTGGDGRVETVSPVRVRPGGIAVVRLRSYPDGTGVPEKRR